MLKKMFIAVGGGVVFVVLAGGGTFIWAKGATADKLAQTFEAHRVEIPVPWPKEAPVKPAASPPLEHDGRHASDSGSHDDTASKDSAPKDAKPKEAAPIDLGALATGEAIARGEHLAKSRFICIECHGADFSGGTMVDDPAIGTLLGPNLTLGEGSVTKDYTTADWDRIVRHGVKPDGKPTFMPSTDFIGMSDQELSDIIAYIRSLPPKDNVVPKSELGPLGTMLFAFDQIPLSAEDTQHRQAQHPKLPPQAEESVAFGKHLAQICTGCHHANLSGGPVPGAAPDWATAANLTPGPQGLQKWRFADFKKAMVQAERPDGSALRMPMTLMTPYAKEMTDTELKALWRYLQSLPPAPTGT